MNTNIAATGAPMSITERLTRCHELAAELVAHMDHLNMDRTSAMIGVRDMMAEAIDTAAECGQ